MNPHDDYLWNPDAAPVDDIAHIEQALQSFSARARKLDQRCIVPVSRPKVWRRVATLALAASVAIAGIYGIHWHRLSWSEGSPWPVTIVREGGATETTMLQVGERIVTGTDQTATLNAARIGKVIIAPNSDAKLVQTGKGRHRIELVQGRLHAKVWAPPNFFRVAHGDSEFVDMGCEFELQIDSPSTGTLTVLSGWVFSQIGFQEVLVPEHYSIAFAPESVQLPVRTDASTEFRDWVNELATGTPDESRTIALSQNIAAAARNEDYFTLHTLLRRHPQLALGPLYPRLAAAFNVEPNESHRARWARGEREAMNEWWRLYPKQPKQWWLNWRDAF